MAQVSITPTRSQSLNGLNEEPTASPTRVAKDESETASSCCNGCKQNLESNNDSVVVSFGSAFYHVDCFRCAKCSNLVEHEANLLLLSDGSPVCQNCSYVCSLCDQAITDEAIVTGNESYHTECFKCKSCQNRIQELVFAKTSQGIYCMSCHNERVSRSRRHAEARKNKATKSKEGKSLLSRSRSQASRPTKTPSPSARNWTEYDFPTPGSSEAPSRGPLSPDSESASPLLETESLATSPTKIPPSSNPSSNTNSANNTTVLPEIVEAEQITPLPRSSSRTDKMAIKSDRDKDMPAPPDSPTISISDHQTASDIARPRTSSRAASPQPRDSSRGRSRTYDGDTSNTLTPPPRQYESSSAIDQLSLSAPPSHRSYSSDAETKKAHRNSMLLPSAKPDKSANRRSGFYGIPSTPPAQPQIGLDSIADSPLAAEPTSPSPRRSVEQERQPLNRPASPQLPTLELPTDELGDNIDIREAKQSHMPESLQKSMSFYDPDLLIYLDAVPATPGAEVDRKSVQLPVDADDTMVGSPALDVPSEQGSPSSQNGWSAGISEAGSDERDSANEAEEGDEAEELNTDQLRESMQRLSRSGSTGMTLELDLVETLIADLESTKDKMKTLQQKYNAIRRASSQYLEGIHSARGEADKEAALRHEAQAEMAELKTQLHEQAVRLATINAEKKADKDLADRSSQLRTSVYGMEKHLSILKAERDMTVAEVAELQSIQSSDDGHGMPGVSLATRLDMIKSEHRQALETLVLERNLTERDVLRLREEKTDLQQEATRLQEQNGEMHAQNAELHRQLEAARESLGRLQMQSAKPAATAMRMREQASSQGRSSLASSVDTIPEAGGLAQATRVEQVAPQPVKKFKWGKGKTVVDQKSAAPTHKAAQGSVASTTRAGSTDLLARHHVFQQVNILRTGVRCEHCTEKMWGLQESRCAACGIYCHSKCAPFYQIHCNSAATEDLTSNAPSAPSVFGIDLSKQAQAENVAIPTIVNQCVQAVESYGMDYEGIYRKTGGMSQVKQITQSFQRLPAFRLEETEWDISAITSVLKNYFRELPIPLFTFDLHDELVSIAELRDQDGRKLDLFEQSFKRLPDAHFAVLQLLMQHLHRVHLMSAENKMNPSNLGVVWSPTLLRSPIAGREFSDINHRAKVVELCIEHAPRLFG